MNILYLISILLFFGINISNGIRNYIYVAKPLSYHVAMNYCKENYGTGLATIKSATENTLANSKCPVTCLVGINDLQGEGQFKNPDGSRALYTNWGPGEPNNVGNEDCVEKAPNGRWNDIGCNTRKTFLCDAPGSGESRDYVYVSTPMTFDGANAYCKNKFRTRLATIKTPTDNAKADQVCTSRCFIGINDRKAEGYFTNPDGLTATYTNWSPGEPNNVGNEDCVEIYAGGRWNDIPCYSKKAFICDKPKPGESVPAPPRNYVYIAAPKTFIEAKLFCQSQVRTSLAIISSAGDNARAASQCRSQCLIGMNDQTAERQWKNIDGIWVRTPCHASAILPGKCVTFFHQPFVNFLSFFSFLLRPNIFNIV